MKITDALMAEHTVFHQLFDYLETATQRCRTLPEVRNQARLLESMLEEHSNAEEELLMEPLDHCLEQIGQRNLFHKEHKEIDHGLRRAVATRDLKMARKSLLDAVLASRRHFDKEERLIFPLAEKVLKARTLSDLGEIWIARRNKTRQRQG